MLSSARNASRTDTRLTPSLSTSSRSGGSRSPGAIPLSLMSAFNCASTDSYTSTRRIGTISNGLRPPPNFLTSTGMWTVVWPKYGIAFLVSRSGWGYRILGDLDLVLIDQVNHRARVIRRRLSLVGQR